MKYIIAGTYDRFRHIARQQGLMINKDVQYIADVDSIRGRAINPSDMIVLEFPQGMSYDDARDLAGEIEMNGRRWRDSQKQWQGTFDRMSIPSGYEIDEALDFQGTQATPEVEGGDTRLTGAACFLIALLVIATFAIMAGLRVTTGH